MPVSYVRNELKEANKRYTPIRDCLGGEIQVKSKGAEYLPVPNDEGKTGTVATDRYINYKKRATFYGVTKRTLDGLCGQIFVRDPVVNITEGMAYLMENMDGSGVDLIQLAKAAVKNNLAFGRAGFFVDYPNIEGTITQAQKDSGEAQPTIKLYEPWKIINWRTITRGARTLLSLVVLEEEYVKEDDGFEAIKEKQWRVLRLKEGRYIVEVYKSSISETPVETFEPTDSAGNTFDEIPFHFVGSSNNDHEVDDAPMYDIASLNLGHYRNSADYEESVFIVGQPTPVFAGLSQDWVTNVLKDKIVLGSRAAVPLPSGGTATLLQASPNSMPLEAMGHKEKQMVALGARLVEQHNVARTATETNKDASAESSVLASSAKNVASGLTKALKTAAKFLGEAPDAVLVTLNTDFDIATMTPEDRRQLIEEWQSGAISWEEVRVNLRKSGIVSQDDETAKEQIEQEQALLPNLQDNSNDGDSDGDED